MSLTHAGVLTKREGAEVKGCGYEDYHQLQWRVHIYIYTHGGEITHRGSND